jgi:hypothetical protein
MTFEELVATSSAWVWTSFGKSVVSGVGGSLLGGTKRAFTNRWNRVEWAIAAKKYRAKLQSLYGTVRILGKVDPMPLDSIFTDVIVLDRPSAYNRYDIQTLKLDPQYVDRSTNRIDGVTLLQSEDAGRLMILGKPGAGKTTFLRHLTILSTNGAIDKIPIFVSVKEWHDSELALMPFLCDQFDICDFPDAEPFLDYVLTTGKAIVMFDGLDEVSRSSGKQEQVIGELDRFTKKYSNARCLVTCRTAAIAHFFEHFRYVEVADFTGEQIDSFVAKWFTKQPKKLARFQREFVKSQNQGIRELAKIPLLLVLICLSFEETMAFPERRAELYEEAVDALLKKWDSSRSIERDNIYKGLSLGRKRQLLARIATQYFQTNQYFIPQSALARQIANYVRTLPDAKALYEAEAEAILKSIEAQHGILVERAHRIYSFSHLTLQEYFTAKYICDHASTGVLKELLFPGHIVDPRWREVFLLTASLLENADAFCILFLNIMNQILGGSTEIRNLLSVIRHIELGIAINVDDAARALYFSILLMHKQIDWDIVGGYAISAHVHKFLTAVPDRLCSKMGVTFPLPEAVVMVSKSGDRVFIDNLEEIRIFDYKPQGDTVTTRRSIQLLYLNLLVEWFGKLECRGAQETEEVRTIVWSVVKNTLSSVCGRVGQEKGTLKPSVEYMRECIGEYNQTYLPTDLSSEESKRGREFFYANALFSRCLELAAVTDRSTFEKKQLWRWGSVGLLLADDRL